MPEQRKSAELVVIGAGPAGYPAAFRAADLGLKVVLIDPEPNPGGVCLYRGCIPSKILLHIVKVLSEARAAAEAGLVTGDLRIDVEKLRAWKNKLVQHLTGGLGQTARKRGVEYVRGMAEFTDRHSCLVRPQDGESYELAFEQAVIATGSMPATIPGMIDSPLVMTSRQALDLNDVPARLLVVGGGYIGIELGQVYAALGTRVTVAEMLPGLLTGIDRDLVEPLQRRLAKQFEAIHLETKVVEMEETDKGVKVGLENKDGKKESAQFDKVMIAVGRKPNTDGLGLARIGVGTTPQGFIDIDRQCRTAVPHIFAVGDVAGEPMLAHKGTHEGIVAAEVAAGHNAEADARAIPFVVFSNPEIAACGLNETRAREKGIPVQIVRFPWAASGRAATLGRTDGLTKLLVDPDSKRVLGLGIVGTNAGELIGQGALALELGAVSDDIARTVATHPTLTETIMEAAEMISGQATHYYERR